MITDQDINMIYRGYRYASGSQSTGCAEPLPNEVLFFLKANTLKVKPKKGKTIIKLTFQSQQVR